MDEIDRSELVAWLRVVPTRMSCLLSVAPELPQDVVLELLRRDWIACARDGRLVRTEAGQRIAGSE